eukprot:6833472-Karenia_brevis.AAC.1
MYNARTVLKSGKTPHEERWGIKFGGPFIPCGAEVHFKPASPKGLDQLHKYGEKCGGGWDESVYVIDWQQLEGAESAKEATPVRIHYKEVVILPGKWRYPVRDGLLKQPDPGQKWSLQLRVIKDSDPENEENEGEEEREGSEPAPCHEPGDQLPQEEPGDSDFWTLNSDVLIRHHMKPRSTLFVPSAEDCPIPWKYVDC